MDSLKLAKLADFLKVTESELLKILDHDPKIINAETYEQALDHYKHSIKGSESEKIAYDTVIEIGKSNVDSIETFEQGRLFLRTVPKNSSLEKAVQEKMLHLATTIKQAREVYEKSNGIVQQNAFHKITSIGTAMLLNAHGFDQAKRIYKKVIKGSVLQHVALTKMLDLAQNVKHAKIVFSEAPPNSELEKAAFAKILYFTTNIEDAVVIYNDMRRNNSLRILSLDRLNEIGNEIIDNSTDLLQIKQVYDLAPKRSTIERAAARKMFSLM